MFLLLFFVSSLFSMDHALVQDNMSHPLVIKTVVNRLVTRKPDTYYEEFCTLMKMKQVSRFFKQMCSGTI